MTKLGHQLMHGGGGGKHKKRPENSWTG